MKKGLFAVCFLALIAVMGGASLVTLLRGTGRPTLPEDVAKDVPAVTSFAALYPFEEGEAGRVTAGHRPLLYAYRLAFRRVQVGANWCSRQGNALGGCLLRIPEGYDEWSRGRVIPNGQSPFVQLSNGYYAFPFPYSHPTESWGQIRDFAAWLAERDVAFLHLIPADKGDDGFASFPEGVPLGYDRMEREYHAFMQANGIDFLDAKSALLERDGNFYSWFYVTDHHWNVHAGRRVAEVTAERLQAMGMATETDALREGRFSLRVFPKCFLGSMGRVLGSRHKEDMEVFYPKGASDFHLQIPSKGIDRCGRFDETLMDGTQLADVRSSYEAFLYSDCPLVRIENLRAANGTRVLVVKHSKANVVCPYLALAVRYVDMIDPRLFDGSIRWLLNSRIRMW